MNPDNKQQGSPETPNPLANPFLAGSTSGNGKQPPEAPPPEGLTFAYLQRLAASDPEAALRALALAESLEKFRLKEEESTARKTMTVRMVQEVRKNAAATAAFQKSCEMVGHRRRDGSCAIGGQKDGSGKLILICVMCQKVYEGIGDGKEQLPPQYAAAIDYEYIGG